MNSTSRHANAANWQPMPIFWQISIARITGIVRLRTKTDASRIPALIPGATYRILRSEKGEPHTAREFTVESNQSLDLGEIVLERKD